MKRRDLLRYLAGTTVAAGSFLLSSPFQPRIRLAQAAQGKTLVVVFQRGACDGLNTVVPYQEDRYYNLRPTIAIAPPNAGNSESAIDLDGFFGLHPALAAFDPIFKAGDMAIMPTVHYPNATRSHFDAQELIQSAASVKAQGLDGWINRYLANHAHIDGQLRAVGFDNSNGDGLAHALRGDVVVSSFGDLGDFDLSNSQGLDPALIERLGNVYSQGANPNLTYSELLQQFGRVTINDLSVISDIGGDYTPANGAVYPNTRYGRQLSQVAQLIKANVGLESAWVDRFGWDHHKNQGGGNSDGTQSRRLKEFGDGIAAMYTDLGTRMNDVIILTMTEFGRTAKENGSGGTDHGNAASWFAVGQSINGGIHLGNQGWPGLAEDQLYRQRYLAHTVDYRDVFGDILTQHLGSNALGSILPGHSYTPVGILPG